MTTAKSISKIVKSSAKRRAAPTDAQLRRQARETLKTLNEELRVLSIKAAATLESLRALRTK